MQKTYWSVGLLSLVLALGFGLSSSSIYAQSTQPIVNASQNKNYGMNLDPEFRAKVEAAILAGDYQTWKTLHEESGRNAYILTVINEANFPRFVEMRKLMIESRENMLQANEIRKELGIEMPRGKGQGMKGQGKHMGRGMGQQNESATPTPVN